MIPNLLFLEYKLPAKLDAETKRLAKDANLESRNHPQGAGNRH